MTSVRLLATAGAALLVAAPVYAQRATLDTTALPTVAVTATRLPVSLGAQPAALTVITAEEIRQRGITRLGEALAQVPGVTLVQQGSVGNITSLFTRGGNSGYTKVLVDGVAVNGAGGYVDLANFTLDNVERIEIARGPASVLYGSDAVSGVVQIFTRRGAGRGRVDVDARTGARDTRDVEASANGALAGARYTAGIGNHRTDGVLAFNNGYRNTTASASLGAGQPGRDGTLTARYTNATYHFPTGSNGEIVDHNQFRDEHRLVVGAEGGRRLGSRVELRSQLSLNATNGINDNQPDGPTDTAGYYGRTESRARRGGADVRANVAVPSLGTATLGVAGEWQRERSAGYSEYAGFRSPDAFNAGNRDLGAYAQLAGARGPATFTLGSRFDDNRSFGGFTSYRGSVGYELPTATRLRVTAGNAFKEPQFSERFNTTFSRGNPALRPEQSRGWEAGIEQRVAGARVGATYFDQRFRDLVQYSYRDSAALAQPGADSSNYYNIAGARSDGAELEIQLPTLRGLSLGGGYTYLRTQVTDSGFGGITSEAHAPLLRRPKHSATLTAGYRVGDAASLSLTSSRIGARDDVDFSGYPYRRVSLAPYTKLDLAADVGLLPARGGGPNASLTLRVDNLTNRHYLSTVGFPGAPRLVMVGVRLGATR